MEISGTVIRQSVSFLRGAGETSPFSMKSRVRARQRAAVAGRPWFDEGHRLYYALPVRCGGAKDAKRKEEKKRAALATKLYRTLYSAGLGMDGGEGFAGEVRGDMIKEAAELLLTQLNQQKAREKEMKKRKKEEKEALKAAKMRNCAEISSSSSSSESSDSEYEEVAVMKKAGKNLQEEVKPISLDGGDREAPECNQAHSSLEAETDEKAELKDHTKLKLEQEELCSNNGMDSAAVVSCSDNIIAVAKPLDKIEVCMGGKCKKSGAIDLLQEFERKVGRDGAVVGCKCMGKCKDGPNVRVVNHCSLQDEFVEVSKKPLCIGVGLDDVSAIVANFLGHKHIDMGLLGA